MKETILKLCLIFSPFSSFSYVPLGIAYLKSYIEKNIPFVQVKNLDLSNNLCYSLEKKEFLNYLTHLCQICPGHRKSKIKGVLGNKKFTYWIKAALVSKSSIVDSNINEFYNPHKYNRSRRLYDAFYGGITFCINRILRYSLEITNQENDIILRNNLFKYDINKILSENPDIVGFSIFSESQFYYSLALAKILKTIINPQIIFGGAYIAHLDKKTILQSFDFIDFIIYKEGELGIVGLLKNLRKRRFDEVPNLVFRKDGKVIENKESIVRNLDQVPFPDFSDYDLKKYFTPRPVLSTLFSRGCFWGACTFCAHHKTYSNPYRIRSVPNLILELERYQKRDIKHIWFADEVISAAHLNLLSKAILKKKIKIYYGVMLRPTKDFTYEILQRMYRSGCRVIIWGVESFNQRILNLMNKGTNAQEIEIVLRISDKIGLSNIVYLIQGFPTQTEKEMLKDIEFLEKNSRYVYRVSIHPFCLEVDTPIFRNPKRYELKDLKRNYLLKARSYKLFSPEVSFNNKKKTDWSWKKLGKILKKSQITYKLLNEFNYSGFFCNIEHALLYLTRYRDKR